MLSILPTFHRRQQPNTVTATAASAVASIQNTVSNMWTPEKKTHYSSTVNDSSSMIGILVLCS
jgi:hypothetical protein